MPFYAVRRGRIPGIYMSWPEAQAQVKGFPNAEHKKFHTRADAELFLEWNPNSSSKGRVSRHHPYASKERPSSSDCTSNGLPSVPSAVPSKAKGGCVQQMNVVYTDGASSDNGKRCAKAGIGVFFGHGDPRNLSEPLIGPRQTNQRAELMACVRALEVLDAAVDPVEIRTDSQYVVKGMNEWIHSWIRNGWKKPVENRDLFERLHELRSRRPVLFTHIRGHAGHEGNEQADRLAVAATK